MKNRNSNKVVLGLNLDRHLHACLISVLSAIALFLPYINVSGEKKSLLSVCLKLATGGEFYKSYLFVILAVAFAAISAVLAVVSVVKTTVVSVKIWQTFQALSTVFWGLLMFSTRTICKVSGLTNCSCGKH